MPCQPNSLPEIVGADWRKIATWHRLRIQRFLAWKQSSRGRRGGGTITKPWEGYSRSSMAQSHLLQLPRGGGLGRFDLIHPEQQCSGSITSSTWQGSDAMKLQHCCPESEHLGRGSVLSLLQYLLPEHLLLDFRAQAAMWKATLLTGKGQRQP